MDAADRASPGDGAVKATGGELPRIAVVMRQYGGPSVLRVDEQILREPLPDHVRVRTIAAAVNLSDLQIRADDWPIRRAKPFPHVPGLERVGEVAETGTAVSGPTRGNRVFGAVTADRALACMSTVDVGSTTRDPRDRAGVLGG